MGFQTRIFVFILGIIVVYVGFMIKLPTAFRYFDKELHSLFYFVAAFMLSWLFQLWSYKSHMILCLMLFLFGIFVELSQHFSNFLFHKRIHGRFDLEDVKYNLYGILAFTTICIVVLTVKKFNYKNTQY